MNPIRKERVWIRIAGNAKRIKEGGKEGWRCFVSNMPIQIPSVDEEIPLTDWSLSGTAVPGANFIPGTYKFGKSRLEPVLVAWIDLFGSITIEEGVAHILLIPAA